MSFAFLWQDLRFGARMLARHRSVTLVAILTLGVGIGANVAVFSVIHAVLERPLPYSRPDRLVKIWEKRAQLPKGRISFADYADWKSQSQSFEAMAAYRTGDFNLIGEGGPEQVQGAAVSAALFPVLGVSPQLGRSFSEADDRPGAPRAAILSDGLWKRRFGGDAAIAGKSIRIDGAPFQVVGVMPAGFYFPNPAVELWEPLAIDPNSRMAGRGMHILDVAGRLRPGVRLEQARGEMATLAARLERAYPRENTGHGADVYLLLDDWTGGYRSSLLLVFGAVTLVLAIACANIATLMLSRAAGRRREIAMRRALGASRARIAGQLLVECVLLALAGAAAGLLLARWLIRAIVKVTPADVPRIGESGLDLAVLGFALAVAVATGIVCGLLPAIQSSNAEPSAALKEQGRGATGSARANRARSILVVAEVALSAVLLAGAGLLLKSLVLVERVDPGFQAAHVLTAKVSLNYRAGRRGAFLSEVLDRIRTDPRVVAAGAVTHLPLAGNGPTFDFQMEGKPAARPGEESKAQLRCATPDYFRALGIPLLAGRGLSETDTAEAPQVVVINDAMARRYWPEGSPLGSRIAFDPGGGAPEWRTIVGVVRGVRHTGLESEPEPQMYAPFSQFSMPFATLAVRASGDPAGLAKTVQGAVAAADPNQPVSGIQSMDGILAKAVAARRFNVLMLGFFAVIAALAASIGVYGVLSYEVAQRRAEIGIRLALGAGTRAVMWMVVRNGMTLALVGVLAGAAGAAILARVLSTLLYRVGSTDPLVFGCISVLLLGVAMAASYVPARRASKVDPVVAMRAE